MARTWLVFRNELRLHFRTPATWLIYLAWHGALGYYLWSATTSPSRLPWAFAYGMWPIFSSLLVVLFVAAAGRDRAERSQELIDALPHRTHHLVVGRWLAGWAAFAPLALEMLVLQAILLGRAGLPGTLWFRDAPYLALEYLGPLLLAAGWGTGTWVLLRGSRLAYPLAAAVWIALVEPPPVAAVRQAAPRLLGWIPDTLDWLCTPLTVARPVFSFSDLWGTAPEGTLVMLHHLAFAALGLALVVGAVLLCGRARENRAYAKAAALVLVVTLLCTSGMAGLVLAGAGRNLAAYRDHATAQVGGTATDGEAAAAGARGVSIERYRLTGALHGDGLLEVQATCWVRNGGTEAVSAVPLALDQHFAVDAPHAGAGWMLRRQGDVLDILLDRPLAPGEERALSIGYRGRIEEWWPYLNLGFYRLAVVTPREVWLPGVFAWYPRLRGADQAFERIVMGNPDYGQAYLMYCGYGQPGAWFDVEMAVPPGVRVGMSLPEVNQGQHGSGERAEGHGWAPAGLSVLGSPWLDRVTAPGLQIFCALPGRPLAEGFLPVLGAAVESFRKWVPAGLPDPLTVMVIPRYRGPHPGGVILIDETSLAGAAHTLAHGGTGAYASDAPALTALRHVVPAWWPPLTGFWAPESRPAGQVRTAATAFVARHFLEEAAARSWVPGGEGGPAGREGAGVARGSPVLDQPDYFLMLMRNFLQVGVATEPGDLEASATGEWNQQVWRMVERLGEIESARGEEAVKAILGEMRELVVAERTGRGPVDAAMVEALLR
ncbi:MAG: hypothetical protein QME70_06210 [Bacillota bacterium]|nr:hypothetical protein [Bacillota bacterium]